MSNRGKRRPDAKAPAAIGKQNPPAIAKQNPPPIECRAGHAKDIEVRYLKSVEDSWREPWIRLLKFLNIQLTHFVGVCVIAALAELVALILNRLAPEPLTWEFRGISVSILQISHYGEFAVLVAYFWVFAFELVKWMRQK